MKTVRHIRFVAARWFLKAALWVMPGGRAKDEFLERVWRWGDRIVCTVELAKAGVEPTDEYVDGLCQWLAERRQRKEA
jgi:hypothetical protein